MKLALTTLLLSQALGLLANATSAPEPLATDCSPLPNIKIDASQGDARECKPIETGHFAKLDNQEFYFTLYCLVPVSNRRTKCDDQDGVSYHRRALVVFSRSTGSSTPETVLTKSDNEIGLYSYDPPQVFQAFGETVMLLPIHLSGSGGGNASEYYVRKDKKWVHIDSTSWIKELNQKIPKDTHILEGIWPDLKRMTARTNLFKKSDPQCCPSGGTAQIQLAFENNRFILKKLEIASPKSTE